MLDKEKFGIVKPGDSKHGRTILIYGEAGRGKTTLLNTIKRSTLLINIDCGEQVLEKNGEVDVFNLVRDSADTAKKRIERFEGFCTWLLEYKEPLPWGVVTIDNITVLQNNYTESLGIQRQVKYPRQLEYRDTGIEMERWLTNLRNLNYRGVHVVYLAWEDTNKIEDKGGEITSAIVPMIMGKTCTKIRGLVDFVMVMRVGKKGERYLQLDGDALYMAKKREEPGIEYPSYIECPKGEVDTLEKFFKLMEGGMAINEKCDKN